MVFNGIIRSVQLSHMKQCIVVGVFLKNLIEQEEQVQPAQVIKASVVFVYIVVLITVCTYTLSRKSIYLHRKKDIIGNMLVGINLKSRFGTLYFSMFLLRFFVFILIGSLFVQNPVFEVQLLMFFNTLCSIWYFQNDSHLLTSRKVHEFTHECFSMIGAYQIMVFTSAFPYDS